MKICILGYSGSGKSTLAKKLGEKYNIPVLYLDSTFWYGNWEHRSGSEQSEIVDGFLKNNDNWVIDGNYFHICYNRFYECDKIIFLDYNRFFCYRQARKRYKKFKGNIRPDCPCEEKFDFEFAKWILWKSRKKSKRDEILRAFESCPNEKLIFKNRKNLNKYLSVI